MMFSDNYKSHNTFAFNPTNPKIFQNFNEYKSTIFLTIFVAIKWIVLCCKSYSKSKQKYLHATRIIHLVRTQNFPKN